MAARLVPDMPLLVVQPPRGGADAPEAGAHHAAPGPTSEALAPALPSLMLAIQLVLRSCLGIA